MYEGQEFGTVELQGTDLEGNPLPFGQTLRYPVYGCGHCSTQVIMRPDRTRERRKCQSCNRFLCEQNEICNSECTPIYSLFEDRITSGKWAKNLGALMAGATNFTDARKLGFDI